MSKNKISVSGNFKKSLRKVILALGLFFISYTLLIAVSIALLIGCGYAGYYLITKSYSFYAIIAGAGLIGLGIMFFLFTIKFIFASHKDTSPYRVEISQKQHPYLFNAIKEVSHAAGVRFPRRVYLSHNVNAGVFYNSSFLSLFLPVRKNLEIGLGLINSVNVGEFKAILAHEFGHFSQRSMRLGSYVYTVNKVIYDLVYDYDSWDKTLEKWANAGGIFGLFAVITFKIVELVRSIMRKSYNLVNLPYMGLSREMEFHADQVAALTAGKTNMISALRRIEFCEIAFQQTMTGLGILANNKQISENIYENHSHEIKKLGEYFRLKFDNGLPIISDNDLNINTVKPRVIIKDQWATHPSREEREKNINKIIQKDTEGNASDCWKLINNFSAWQKKVTKNLYFVDYGNISEFEVVAGDVYENKSESEKSKYRLNEIFNGFYTGRTLIPMDLDSVSGAPFDENLEEAFRDIYSKTTKLKFEKYELNRNDLQTLNRIKTKEIKTKYFEFDNVKYNVSDVYRVAAKLEHEINMQKSELIEIEERAMKFNLAVAGKFSADVMHKVLNVWKILASLQTISEKHQQIMDRVLKYQFEIFNNPQMKGYEVESMNRELIQLEKEHKNYITGLSLEMFGELSSEQSMTLNNLIYNEIPHMRDGVFNMEGFAELINAVLNIHEIIGEMFMVKLKKVTDYQAAMYDRLNINVAEVSVRK